MSKSPEYLLALRFGKRTVGENLDQAMSTGVLVEKDDNSLSLAEKPISGEWASVPNGPPLDCGFLFNFMFRTAYARSAVPSGCQSCYKIKVALGTLRELVAAWGVAKRIACRSKWGSDLANRYSQDIYAGYFYVPSLEAARALFRIVREAIDGDPLLGSHVKMTIKRGCSEYEAYIGPSDTYEFTPEQAELEAHLRTRYRNAGPAKTLPPVPMAHWIDVAFRTGDETYLDFTGGQRLQPKTIAYDP